VEMAAQQENVSIRVEKLGDDNYQYWSFQVKMLLQSRELWDVIEDFGPAHPGERPEDAASLPVFEQRMRAFNEWDRKNKKAMNYIALNVDSANANLIYHLTLGSEAWEALRDHHMMKSLGNKMRTKKKLYSMKLERGGSMKAHLNLLTELFNKLVDLGDPVAEDQKITTVLSSVEPEYEALTTAIMAWNQDRLTMHEVKERLIEEYEKKKENVVQTEESFATGWK
jgi:hypothetical protein